MRSSPEARRLVTCCNQARGSIFVRAVSPAFFLCIVWFFFCSTCALAQSNSPGTPAPAPATHPEGNQTSAELASHDEPTTFKVNVKLVVVRAVVRDSQGHAVGNLHKEDFQVFDKGKPQVITQFEVEEPGALTAKARQTSHENFGDAPSGEAPPNTGGAAAVPERFVAYLFDDVHLEFGDLAHVREAAKRHFSTLRPTDRAAIFTTSGVTNLEFTDDRTRLHQTLLHLQPRPISSNSFKNQQCPDISYYQADLIVNKLDAMATQVAIQEANDCAPTTVNGPGQQGVTLGNSAALVNAIAAGVLNAGQHESHISLGSLRDIVRNVSRMPGQRSVVLVSPGFIAPDMQYEYNEIIDRAVRSQIVINALEARGLYVIIPYGDASRQPAAPPGGRVPGLPPPPVSKTLIQVAAAAADDDLLAALADGTGGVFFHNNNDFDEGFRRVAETPEYSYVLAFAPQNLKLDGAFHTLKITLKSPQKLSLQARRGYYAPKNFTDPNEQAKQEIEDALYSQEELHNLPVKLHTQFFKASDEDAKLIVLAQVDVRHLHFRKVEGRNDNVLTCVSALFNRNGKFIQGTEKTVTMHWKDETLEHKLAAGIMLKTSFDVKPGSYLVRLVVRDAEGQLMSAENGTVEIR
ncbi:MAG TPA: VWA domain-containing protein [Candidatus Acidoferrum sp.]|jgi:VWFA-related protein|nr:VWA domain-containing protein [Candidatus Acidoferrum sp.]